MDNQDGQYAKSAAKVINKQLYNRMNPTDVRRDWWDPNDKDAPLCRQEIRVQQRRVVAG